MTWRNTRHSLETVFQETPAHRLTRYSLEVRFVSGPDPVPDPPPDAPTNPNATAQSFSSIQVTWVDVADETGYRVERSDDGSTGWTNVSGALAADTTSYLDEGLDPETQYFYRVVAFNANGDSDPSSVVNATTLAVLVGSW